MQAAMDKTVKVTPDVVPTTAVAVQLFEGSGGNCLVMDAKVGNPKTRNPESQVIVLPIQRVKNILNIHKS